jgi:hypothetical protein
MEYVYVLFPTTSFVLSRSVVKKACLEDQLGLSYRFNFLLMLIVVAFLGATGYDVYAVNDQTTSTLFLVLCWLLGNGYILVNTFCNPYLNVLYMSALLITGIMLYNKLHSVGKFLGRDMLYPFFIYVSFLLLMSLYGLPLMSQFRALKQKKLQ